MATDSGGPGTLDVRAATNADREKVIALLGSSLGWQADGEYERLFAWKHDESPFGRSPAWVALDGERIVGFRTMMRWEFTLDGVALRAVRAVDTATHPSYQGRGIFSRLTRQALSELEDEGTACVFNTPNSQSLPGYLKMGWAIVGRVPLTVRPRSLLSLGRMLRARTPAERWSIETAVGLPADEALADDDAVAQLLASQPTAPGLRTRRSADFLRWRYGGLPRLAYRVLTVTTSLADGFAVFRLRRRGDAVEAVVADEFAADGGRRALDAALRSLPSRTGCDYVIRAGNRAAPVRGFVPLPRQGPVLTCRPLGAFQAPSKAAWNLAIGDVELF